MDSARDFDLLGESVPQVRVSARTLALLGFFSTFHIYIYKLRGGGKVMQSRQKQELRHTSLLDILY